MTIISENRTTDANAIFLTFTFPPPWRGDYTNAAAKVMQKLYLEAEGRIERAWAC
jgi:hypothetical protein